MIFYQELWITSTTFNTAKSDEAGSQEEANNKYEMEVK
jgi:hypothetical protein